MKNNTFNPRDRAASLVLELENVDERIKKAENGQAAADAIQHLAFILFESDSENEPFYDPGDVLALETYGEVVGALKRYSQSPGAPYDQWVKDLIEVLEQNMEAFTVVDIAKEQGRWKTKEKLRRLPPPSNQERSP